MAKWLLLGAGIAMAALTTNGGQAPGLYPTKLIRSSSRRRRSASDVLARIMLDRMSKNMKQDIVIENRPRRGRQPPPRSLARYSDAGRLHAIGALGTGGGHLSLTQRSLRSREDLG